MTNAKWGTTRGSQILGKYELIPDSSATENGATGFLNVSSLFPPTLSRLKNEIKIQITTALPTLVGMQLLQFPWLITLRFLGGIGAQELAAAALASTVYNTTGLSLSVGLSSAITTLTSQARGDLMRKSKKQATIYTLDPNPNNEVGGKSNNLKREVLSTASYTYGSTASFEHDESESCTEDTSSLLLPLVFLYRGLFVQFMFVLPIGLWWIYGIRSFLMNLGQNPVIASMTEEYLRILTPGLWSFSINWTVTAWLQALEMADLPAYSAALGLAMHFPINYLFVYVLNWGYLGCAAATVVYNILQPPLMLSYLFFTTQGRKRLLKNMAAEAVGRDELSFWNESKEAVFSLPGIRQYLGLAIPGIIIISEWWASETSVFLAGRLAPSPALALGGMSLYHSINSFCYMIPYSFGVAVATRVGNLLGAGDPMDARFAANVGVLCAASISCFISCILFFTPHTYFPTLFAPGKTDLILEASKTISLLAIYVVVHGTQAGFNGIIKGCGRQVIQTPIAIIAYWIVAVPLAYYFAFVQHDGYMCDDNQFCGIVGLVSGMTIGTLVHMILLGFIILGTTNWAGESAKAKARLYNSRELLTNLSIEYCHDYETN